MWLRKAAICSAEMRANSKKVLSLLSSTEQKGGEEVYVCVWACMYDRVEKGSEVKWRGCRESDKDVQ